MEFSNTYSELTAEDILKVSNLFPTHLLSTFRCDQNYLAESSLKNQEFHNFGTWDFQRHI